MADGTDDEVLLEELWRAHHREVLAYCRRRIAPEEASEVAAEVFAVAWRRLDSVPAEPRAWLLGVARRLLANRRRAATRRARLLDRIRGEVAGAVPGVPLPDRGLAEAYSAMRVRLHRARRRLASALGSDQESSPHHTEEAADEPS